MNNTQNSENYENLEDELHPEYNFDYSQARPNRFALFDNKDSIAILKLMKYSI